MYQNHIKLHSTQQTIILHLLPGILTGGGYFLIRQPVQNLGYPTIFALILAVVFILIPVELGYLLFQGKQKCGRFTLKGMISYRQSIPWWQYIVWVVGIFVATGAIFTFLKPIEWMLQERVFFWIPSLSAGLDGNYSRSTLIVTYVMFFVFIACLGPLVEELYFRGYLLPRMKGTFAPLFHSFLFAAYHIFTPWMIVARTIGLLPLIYAVKKKNIYIGIAVHVLVNSLDVVTGIVFIVKLSS
jgi:uncharacterized protein